MQNENTHTNNRNCDYYFSFNIQQNDYKFSING